MAFPVLSTYRLQMRGDCFTFADAVDVLDYLDDLGVSHLYLSPILTAVAGFHARLRRHRPHHRVGRARRRRRAGAAVGGGAGPRDGSDRRHRAQPRRRRQARAEHVVVGRAEHGRGLAVRVILRHRLDAGQRRANWCCRCWAPTTTSPIVDHRPLRSGALLAYYEHASHRTGNRGEDPATQCTTASTTG